MMNARQAQELVLTARPDFFIFEPHRLIFECMLRLRPPFEAMLLAGELDRAGLLERAGGLSYLLDLDWGVVTANSMTLRVERLRELWCLRAVDRMCDQIKRGVREPLSTSGDIIARIENRLAALRA